MERVPPFWLQTYSKILVFSVFLLIFAGAMVKSTDSGLSVPDWPLSYGMLFPPMVGGIFYEHGHRLMASLVGLMTIAMLIFVFKYQLSPSVKKIALLCLFAVISQGLLGGITVLLYLPDFISLAHAVLAQTFFLLTILLAYKMSTESLSSNTHNHIAKKKIFMFVLLFLSMLYGQLFIGGLMRHTESGLAIYDFPLHAGHIIPTFDKEMLKNINDWRFDHNLDLVSIFQVIIHFIHRFFAVLILLSFFFLSRFYRKEFKLINTIQTTIYWMWSTLLFQIMLGAMTIWSIKNPLVASLHLCGGALLLGLTFLLLLRVKRLL